MVYGSPKKTLTRLFTDAAKCGENDETQTSTLFQDFPPKNNTPPPTECNGKSAMCYSETMQCTCAKKETTVTDSRSRDILVTYVNQS
jgi:hypothetical protein